MALLADRGNDVFFQHQLSRCRYPDPALYLGGIRVLCLGAPQFLDHRKTYAREVEALSDGRRYFPLQRPLRVAWPVALILLGTPVAGKGITTNCIRYQRVRLLTVYRRYGAKATSSIC